MIDAEKAYKLANDFQSALGAEAVVMIAFKKGHYCCDIIGKLGEALPIGVEGKLRELADSIARTRK